MSYVNFLLFSKWYTIGTHIQRTIMLHEYRDEIHELKQQNAHFAHIFEKHNELDKKIEHAENGDVPMTDLELETLKKEKLLLKDEAYKMIMDYRKANA